MRYFYHELSVFVIVASLSAESSSAEVSKQFEVLGKFYSCNSDNVEQANEAQHNLNNRAAGRCQPGFVAVQVGETKFVEANACIHYTRGQLADGFFDCRPIDSAVFKVNVYVTQSQCHDQNIVIDRQRLLEMARPVCGSRSPTETGPLTIGCDSSISVSDENIPLLRASVNFRCGSAIQ